MITTNIITQVVSKLVATAHPLKVILFGSCARGNVGVGVDVLVYSQEEVEEWGHLPGTALYSALKEGKVIYEATH